MTKAIALVPARCGSKSIPLKNIKSFCGEPLIYWTLNALNNSESVERIILATDCREIASVAENFGLKKVEVYMRKPENASDTSSTESVMLETIEALNLDINKLFMLVQATSPLLTEADVTKAISMYLSGNYDSLLSCVRTKRFFWGEDGKPLNYDFTKRPRRQYFDGSLMENGALYISTVQNILTSKNRLSGRIGIFEMPEHSATEIDEEYDWPVAEALMRKYILRAGDRPKIKLFATDVDGVLTDAGMYYSESGEELKKFNTLDGKGFELLRNAGVQIAILTSENTKIVERRATKLKVDYVYQGVNDKLAKLMELCALLKISPAEVAYIGDDINDMSILNEVGYAACPSNAVESIKNIAGIRNLESQGGNGVVREFIQYLFSINAI